MARKTVFVGIDVSKADFCVFHSGTGEEFTLANTSIGHHELIARLGCPQGLCIALEPTGGCEWVLWESLEGAGFDVRQVSAAHVRAFARSLGNLAKTDPLDARMIARFIAFRPEAGRRLPAKILRDLNVLTTKRRQLVAMRKRLSCQVKQRVSLLTEDMDADLMTLLKAQIEHLGARIEALLKSDDALRNRVDILRSIPGIGPVVSAALIGQMPELGHLGEKQAAALVGLAPVNRDSGKYAGHRSIKGGRTWLRELLYQAALVASNHNPPLKAFAKRLKDKGKPHKLVLIAVARKLIIIANAMLARNTRWKDA